MVRHLNLSTDTSRAHAAKPCCTLIAWADVFGPTFILCQRSFTYRNATCISMCCLSCTYVCIISSRIRLRQPITRRKVQTLLVHHRVLRVLLVRLRRRKFDVVFKTYTKAYIPVCKSQGGGQVECQARQPSCLRYRVCVLEEAVNDPDPANRVPVLQHTQSLS